MTTDDPRTEATDEDGRLARRRVELRTGEAAERVARAAAADLLAELPTDGRHHPRSS